MDGWADSAMRRRDIGVTELGVVEGLALAFSHGGARRASLLVSEALETLNRQCRAHRTQPIESQTPKRRLS